VRSTVTNFFRLSLNLVVILVLLQVRCLLVRKEKLLFRLELHSFLFSEF